MRESELFFSFETVVAYAFKVGRCIKRNKQMKLHECKRSRSLTDLGRRSLKFQN